MWLVISQKCDYAWKLYRIVCFCFLLAILIIVICSQTKKILAYLLDFKTITSCLEFNLIFFALYANEYHVGNDAEMNSMQIFQSISSLFQCIWNKSTTPCCIYIIDITHLFWKLIIHTRTKLCNGAMKNS